jgi:hypothetical protein
MSDLFPADVDLGQRRIVNGGCTDPIGKVPGRPRRRSYNSTPPRPTTMAVLSDIRRLLTDDLPTLRHGQNQLRRGSTRRRRCCQRPMIC